MLRWFSPDTGKEESANAIIVCNRLLLIRYNARLLIEVSYYNEMVVDVIMICVWL